MFMAKPPVKEISAQNRTVSLILRKIKPKVKRKITDMAAHQTE